MTPEERAVLIAKIEALPAQLRALIAGAAAEQLTRPYREGGWNSRQVIHHIADSHMQALIRAKLIVTEDHPTIKPYKQDAWAEHADASSGPLEPSLAIIDGVHQRWAAFLRSLPEDAWTRTAHHPERGDLTLEDLLRIYSGHGEKHLAHIRDGMGA